MGIVEEGAYTFVCIYDSTLDNKGNWTLTDTNSNEVIISNDTTLPGGTVADVVLSITGGNTLFILLSLTFKGSGMEALFSVLLDIPADP